MRDKTKTLFQFSLTIVGIVVAMYGFHTYIDFRIESALQDEETLRSISSKVRPSCIFNEKGAILVDLGAMDHIDEIELKGIHRITSFPQKIIIRPNPITI